MSTLGTYKNCACLFHTNERESQRRRKDFVIGETQYVINYFVVQNIYGTDWTTWGGAHAPGAPLVPTPMRVDLKWLLLWANRYLLRLSYTISVVKTGHVQIRAATSSVQRILNSVFTVLMPRLPTGLFGKLICCLSV